jgi:hypothetical protein
MFRAAKPASSLDASVPSDTEGDGGLKHRTITENFSSFTYLGDVVE